jgi:hypothetical protein
VLSPSGPTEIAWYAGGGGLSPIEPVPAFQSATKVLGAGPLLRRGVPDVSLDADPESGYEVIVSGAQETGLRPDDGSRHTGHRQARQRCLSAHPGRQRGFEEPSLRQVKIAGF